MGKAGPEHRGPAKGDHGEHRSKQGAAHRYGGSAALVPQRVADADDGAWRGTGRREPSDRHRRARGIVQVARPQVVRCAHSRPDAKGKDGQDRNESAQREDEDIEMDARGDLGGAGFAERREGGESGGKANSARGTY